MRSNRSRIATIALAAALLLTLPGCVGGGKKEEAKKEKPKSATTLPVECKDVDAENGQPLPADCADAVYAAGIADAGSKELKKVDKDRQLAFGRGMCAYASALAESPDKAPTYSELIESTSKSWGVSKDTVEEVLNLAASLCPGQLEPILALRKKTGSVTVEMSVIGPGKADVTYTLPTGDDFQDSITTPWEHQVILDSARDFRLTARTDKGEVTCSITVEGQEVISKKGKDGAEAVCEATSAQINSAAR